MVTLNAPAKINLTMEVLRKRADGYHEIRSVVQTIGLADTLTFTDSENLEFRSTAAGWFADMSLVSKAAQLVRETIGRHSGATIEIQKRIPLTAGLGGDSSDAAAVLVGLDRLWGLGIPDVELVRLASTLGSDVPFFLRGGTALIAGRGEIVTPLPSLHRHYVVLVNPTLPRPLGKTAAAYAALKPSHFTDGSITGKLVEDVKAGKEVTPSRLFNTFENVAFAAGAELATYRSHIRKIGAPHVHLAGSGPALFTLLRNRVQAEDLATRLKNQGMETYLAQTLNSKP